MAEDMKAPIWIDAVSLTVTPQLFVLSLHSPIPEGDGFIQQPVFRCAMTRQGLRTLVDVAAKALSAAAEQQPSTIPN